MDDIYAGLGKFIFVSADDWGVKIDEHEGLPTGIISKKRSQRIKEDQHETKEQIKLKLQYHWKGLRAGSEKSRFNMEEQFIISGKQTWAKR